MRCPTRRAREGPRQTPPLLKITGLNTSFGPFDVLHGNAAVHQVGGTFALMNIGLAFAVGEEPTKGWGPFRVGDRKRAIRIAVKAARDQGITRITDGDRLVGSLSGGEPMTQPEAEKESDQAMHETRPGPARVLTAKACGQALSRTMVRSCRSMSSSRNGFPIAAIRKNRSGITDLP